MEAGRVRAVLVDVQELFGILALAPARAQKDPGSDRNAPMLCLPLLHLFD